MGKLLIITSGGSSGEWRGAGWSPLITFDNDAICLLTGALTKSLVKKKSEVFLALLEPINTMWPSDAMSSQIFANNDPSIGLMPDSAKPLS